MATSNGKITAPISISDVSATLGVSSSDVGYLCANAHGKINKWAKRKPVRRSELFCQDFSSGFSGYIQDWWTADQNCGLNIPSYDSMSSLMAAIDNGVDWSYLPPIGGTSSPYRLTDFERYDHNAVQPVDSFSAPDLVVNAYASSTIVGFLQGVFRGLADSVSLLDIPFIQELFFGICIRNSSGSTYRWATNTHPLKEMIVDAEVGVYNIALGQWYAYPFLAQAAKPTWDASEGSNRFYALPIVRRKAFTVIRNYLAVYVRADFTANRATIECLVTVENAAGVTTLTGCTLYLRLASNDYTSPQQPGEHQVTIGNNGTINVPANGTTSVTYTFSSLIPNKDYRVWFNAASDSSLRTVADVGDIE